MANYNATSRSNYFKVKDADAFKAWVVTIPDLRAVSSTERTDAFAIISDDGDTGQWPITYGDCGSDASEEEYVDINWSTDLGTHLVDGEVCIMMSAGSEGTRYVCGGAFAFDNTGKTVRVSLDEIYTKAAKAFGVTPTVAEY